MCPVERYWLCWARALLLEGSNGYTQSFCTSEISYGGCSQGKGYRMLRYKNTSAHSLQYSKTEWCVDVGWCKRTIRSLGELTACMFRPCLSLAVKHHSCLCAASQSLYTHLHFQESPKLVLPVSCSQSSGWL